MNEKRALICVQSDIVGGEKTQKKIIRDISEFVEVLAISSLFKCTKQFQKKFDSYLMSVMKVETTLSSEQILEKLLQLEDIEIQNEIFQRRIYLLGYEDELKMSPEMTLPHPALHSDNYILQCASEVWGDYVHPILKSKLKELDVQHHEEIQGDFVSQGRALLMLNEGS
jgi:7,8-dihydro-6-hydroxymethylpterin-pyrophosphokinase